MIAEDVWGDDAGTDNCVVAVLSIRYGPSPGQTRTRSIEKQSCKAEIAFLSKSLDSNKGKCRLINPVHRSILSPHRSPTFTNTLPRPPATRMH